MKRQPIGAYHYEILKMVLVLIPVSWFMEIISENYGASYTGIWFFLIIGTPYAIYEKLRYNNRRYNISEENITLERGILSKTTDTIIFNLIGDVSVAEPILLRILGSFARLEFSTTSRDAELILWREDAISLQNLITAKMSANRLTMINHKN